MLVAMVQPNVRILLLLSPPSDAMCIRFRERNAFQRVSSVATCVKESSSLR